MMNYFSDIYQKRHQDAGWFVAQANTLIKLAIEKNSNSLLLYAAVELRMAVEQLLFTIICLVSEEVDDELLKKCRKKDGLFKTLREIEPNYTMMIRFGKILSESYPYIPEFANWDIKTLKKFHNRLSDFCHSPLVVYKIEETPNWTNETKDELSKIYDYLAQNMKKGTPRLEFHENTPSVNDLFLDFINKRITEDDVRARYKIIKPYLEDISKIRDR